jgi:hypothetical protein
MKNTSFIILCNLLAVTAFAQTLKFQNQTFELKNVTGTVTKLHDENVLKIERDLNALPFDVKNLGATVDEPTYAKLADVDFENGTIEVMMLSRIQNPSPFEFAQGFIGVAFRINEDDSAYESIIGVAFRINEDDSAYESIYLRPKVGRSDNQFARNKTVQYYAYPDYKFDKLRKEADGKYETTAPVDINEWIKMRIEVTGSKAHMFINDAKYSTFVVDKMKGKTTRGAIGLWVDIGTIGFFKDLKITKR